MVVVSTTMIITQVRVQNYKSIIDTGWVPIEDDITTLLGRNEGGKTSFLEGIRYFGQDEEIDEEVIHDGLDDPDDVIPITSLRVELSAGSADRLSGQEKEFDEEDEIIAKKFSDGSRELTTLQGGKIEQVIDPYKEAQQRAEECWQALNKLRNQNPGNYRNHFDNNLKQNLNGLRNNDDPNGNQVETWSNNLLNGLKDIPEQNEEITEAKQKWTKEFEKLSKLLSQNQDGVKNFLPPIVYHGGFDTISDDVQVHSIDTEEHRTFRNLLKIVDFDYEEFNGLDRHDQNQALNKAEGTLRGKVNEFWEQKEIDVDISYRDNHFMVEIKDTALSHRNGEGEQESKNVSRLLKRPSDRSKGFQWFFSFYINLRAETDDQESENQIILLDDPAVFLHPEGKKNWLNAVEEMAESAQIIYSSHSPFLIRKEYPNRIRVVQDREGDGTIVTDDFHESDSMTLEPLRNALGIGLGDSPFVSTRKILVEGVSDYDILIGLSNYFRDHLDEDILAGDEVTIMPTNGADNMIQAAKWVASEEFSYVLLLDNDQKGSDVIQEIEDHHQEVDSDRIVTLEIDDDKRDFDIEIEDMFETDFYIDCVNTVYSEQFDDFDSIGLEETDGEWLIDGYEYKGRKIMNRIEDIFEERERGEPDKILIANEIQERLNENRDVSPDDVQEFKSVLGKIRSLT